MNFGLQLIFFLIILFVASSLVLISFSLSSYGCLVGFLTSRIFVFVMFNIGICFILVKGLGQSTEWHNDTFLLGDLYRDDAEETSVGAEMRVDETCYSGSSDSDDDYSSYNDSDGFEDDNDDDDNRNNDEAKLDRDDEEYDDDYDDEGDDLQSRIEEFIAKVIKVWKEELLTDQLNSEEVD